MVYLPAVRNVQRWRRRRRRTHSTLLRISISRVRGVLLITDGNYLLSEHRVDEINLHVHNFIVLTVESSRHPQSHVAGSPSQESGDVDQILIPSSLPPSLAVV